MKTNSPNRLHKFLHLDYAEKNTIWLSNQDTLRKLVGLLGVALPLLLYVFLYIDNGHAQPLYSISHYYLTRVGSIFVIIVSLMAIFLLIYKGMEAIDFYLSAAAGIFALTLILFPTDNITETCCDPGMQYSVTHLHDSPFRVGLHYLSAAIFLFSLAMMSIFLFTRSNKTARQRTPEKRRRNRIYRTCGVIMLLAMLVIVAGKLKWINPVYYSNHHFTFWMETIAIESFGVSWLIKGKAWMKDKITLNSARQ
jgi:formate hydrogenlyase subunit 3/multisubunit Na+/H+ antiporter MnhD subunit